MLSTSGIMMQCHIPEESNPQHNESLGTAMNKISNHCCYQLAKILQFWNIWTEHVITATMPDKV
jgi:hypothetical protein